MCAGYAERGGRCLDCYRKAEGERGTSAARGYSGKRWKSARKTTLRRDPVCTCEAEDHGHEPGRCLHLSNVADHFPESRKELLARGVLDPDDPKFLRGLCRSCHSRETARNQPGGWATS